MEKIINKVAESGLITLDLSLFYPEEQAVVLDLKDFLFMEMILKEKEFREKIDQHDWQQYSGKDVAVFCSTDAIVPLWAYMLVAAKLSGTANLVFEGSPEEIFKKRFLENILLFDASPYDGKRVVVKGCGDKNIPPFAYLEISNKLLPVVKSLMYGEPCSTVPVFKRK
jgi:hypothetical protein